MAKSEAVSGDPQKLKCQSRPTLLRQPALGPYENELLEGIRSVFKVKSNSKVCPHCEGSGRVRA
jgi:hypothetical protein